MEEAEREEENSLKKIATKGKKEKREQR